MTEPTVKITPATEAEAPKSVDTPTTFTFQLGDGSQMVVGKPQGVLKLRLRDVLPKEYLDDPEMVSLATALLSIRSIDGAPAWLQNYNHLEALVNRFGSDERIDEFMGQYNRLVNPKMMEVVEAAVDEARRKGIKVEDMKDFVANKVVEYTEEQRKQLKN